MRIPLAVQTVLLSIQCNSETTRGTLLDTHTLLPFSLFAWDENFEELYNGIHIPICSAHLPIGGRLTMHSFGEKNLGENRSPIIFSFLQIFDTSARAGATSAHLLKCGSQTRLNSQSCRHKQTRKHRLVHGGPILSPKKECNESRNHQIFTEDNDPAITILVIIESNGMDTVSCSIGNRDWSWESPRTRYG